MYVFVYLCVCLSLSIYIYVYIYIYICIYIYIEREREMHICIRTNLATGPSADVGLLEMQQVGTVCYLRRIWSFSCRQF